MRAKSGSSPKSRRIVFSLSSKRIFVFLTSLRCRIRIRELFLSGFCSRLSTPVALQPYVFFMLAKSPLYSNPSGAINASERGVVSCHVCLAQSIFISDVDDSNVLRAKFILPSVSFSSAAEASGDISSITGLANLFCFMTESSAAIANGAFAGILKPEAVGESSIPVAAYSPAKRVMREFFFEYCSLSLPPASKKFSGRKSGMEKSEVLRRGAKRTARPRARRARRRG